MSHSPSGSRLPYFDMIRRALDDDRGEIRTALGHHVHFGYWPTPPPIVTSAESFRAAAERLSLGLATMAGVRDGMSVLDVGCGFGGTLSCLDRNYRQLRLTGLNLDERQLIHGRREVLAGARNPVRLINGDACRLPFDDQSFDAVTAVECILHFPDRAGFFREAHRVLRRGGCLALTDYIPGRWLVPSLKVAQNLTNPQGRSHGPVDITWTLDAYRRLARHTGLAVAQEVDITRQTLPSYAYLRRLLQVITRSPTEYWSLTVANSYSEGLSRLGWLRYMALSFRVP